MPARRRATVPADPANEQQRLLGVEDNVRRHAEDLDDIADQLGDLEDKIDGVGKASAERHEKLVEQIRGPGGIAERLLVIEASLKTHTDTSKAQNESINAALKALTEAVKPDPQHYTLTMDKTTAGTLAGLIVTVLTALGYGFSRGDAQAGLPPSPPARSVQRPDPALAPSPYPEAAKDPQP